MTHRSISDPSWPTRHCLEQQIQAQGRTIEELTASVGKGQAKIDGQQVVIDQLRDERDRLQDTLDLLAAAMGHERVVA